MYFITTIIEYYLRILKLSSVLKSNVMFCFFVPKKLTE